MSQKINIFFTGATGYIGGSVLCRLIDHPDASSFNITALVRSPEKAAKLEKLGVKAVVGSHSDPVITEKLASEADYVIATADADNMVAAKAILSGLKKRFESTGKPPVLIHTSGTGVLTDKAAGDNTNDVIYDDLNPDQIETLPDSQLHRDVDLTLLQADKDGYVRVYIVVPSTIYGIAKGKLVDAGIQNPHSIQVPALIYTAIARRQAGTIGAGKNFWPDVNIEDVADLYLVVFNAIRSNPDKVGHGRSGFFFGENGEHQMFEIAQAIGQALVELGLATDSSYTTFTKEEIDKHFQGSTYLGTNARCRSNHGRSLGWNPKYTKEDFLASIKAEVEVLAAKGDQRTEFRQ